MAEHVQKLQTKIIRREHHITIGKPPHETAGSLQKALESVPSTAKLTDIDEDASGRTILIFCNEVSEPTSEEHGAGLPPRSRGEL